EVLGTARGKTPGGIASRRSFQDRAVGPASARSSWAHGPDCVAQSGKRIANGEWSFLVRLLFATRHSPLANKTRQAERRQTPPHQSAPSGAARALRGALRLPAFHRGSRGSEPTPPLSSRRASWDLAKRRWLSAPACPSPAIQSQAGRNAGRAFSRSRPGAEVTSPCPQAPLSLRQPE